MKKLLLLAFVLIFLPSSSFAQESELVPDKFETVKAKVISINSQENRLIPGTSKETIFQSINIEILEGRAKGQTTSVENDHLKLETGDIFYLRITTHSDGSVVYAVSEPYRINQIILLTIIFLALVVIFGGWQGLRGLASLAGSLILIFYIMLPQLLAGHSPLLVSILVASLIIVVGSYITHGFNRTTSSAVVGMVITVLLTGALSFYAVGSTKLTGYGSEDAVYLSFNTNGILDMPGLLLAGILIGLLGVLYDVAIGQAITVEELLRAAPHMSTRKVFERAIRVGREHIGALINTLAIAYVGASLPLLLLFYSSSSAPLAGILNREDFSTEIVRTLIGSSGLVLAVPITSLVSVLMLRKVFGGPGKPINEGHPHIHHH